MPAMPVFSPRELREMGQAIAETSWTLTLTVWRKGTATDAYLPVLDPVTQALLTIPGSVSPAIAVERASGQEFYRRPVDAMLRTPANPLLLPGLQVRVASVNGQIAPPAQAVSFEILSVDDLLFLGVINECRLWRMA